MRTITPGIALFACALALAACRPTQPTDDAVSQAGDNVPSPSPTAPADAATAGQAATPLAIASNGRLADASGRSVYVLAGNQDGSECDAACEDAWPPVLINAAIGTVPGIPAGMLGTRARADGTLQATYDGEPLYRYAGDGSPDSTSGDGVRDQWGEWHLARADASTSAPIEPTSPPASQSPPPGY